MTDYKQVPVAYKFVDTMGRARLIFGKETAEYWCAPNEKIEPLYTTPQPAEQPDVTQLVEALEQARLTLAIIDRALVAYQKQGGKL